MFLKLLSTLKVFSYLVSKQTCALITLEINLEPELNLNVWNFLKKKPSYIGQTLMKNIPNEI